ncbi:hypothetical protein BLEM_1985 [Bifidobacterium lemurum]|uniref:Uncharacterized protein n=1 Tax=Bifidobacterium lemurum TaxID=1603886 RepID=A0A261FN93_9BIFI|nr:hypothetical protein BLEM_1985 [Bifidobacterium lemurum]
MQNGAESSKGLLDSVMSRQTLRTALHKAVRNGYLLTLNMNSTMSPSAMT